MWLRVKEFLQITDFLFLCCIFYWSFSVPLKNHKKKKTPQQKKSSKTYASIKNIRMEQLILNNSFVRRLLTFQQQRTSLAPNLWCDCSVWGLKLRGFDNVPTTCKQLISSDNLWNISYHSPTFIFMIYLNNGK